MSDTPTPRDLLRAAVFADHQFKRVTVDVLGASVDLREPSLADIGRMGTKVITVADILIDYGFVPGTNDKAFEEADRDILGTLPASDWVRDLSTKFAALIGGGDEEDAVKN